MSRFHADLHIAAGAALDPVGSNGLMTGGILLFNPDTVGAVVRKLMVSTDAGMRIVVGAADQDSQRIRGAYFAANGGAAPDCCVQLAPGQKVYVFHPAAGNIEVAIDGDLLDG